MIHFKNHFRKGFSFIEAVMALAIIAIAISSFMVLQQNIFRRVAYNSFKIERLYRLRNIFSFITANAKVVESAEKINEDLKIFEKDFTNPDVHIVYERLPISKDSALARFEGLYQERVTGSWHDSDRKRMLDLYRYGYDMPQEQEKKP